MQICGGRARPFFQLAMVMGMNSFYSYVFFIRKSFDGGGQKAGRLAKTPGSFRGRIDSHRCCHYQRDAFNYPGSGKEGKQGAPSSFTGLL